MLTFAPPLVLPLLGPLVALMAQDAAQESKAARGDSLVKVELLADRAAIRPGEAFTLAVHFTVEPGWHIYWDNPGDSGLPTKIHMQGPEGFEIGEPRAPAPVREVTEGDIVTYVHKGEVVYLVDARAPKVLPKGLAPGLRAAFDVDASWLVCIEACYRGAGKAHLKVPLAAPEAAASALANEKIFAAARARMPRPWKELESADLEWSGSGERRMLRITVPGATALELFPLASETTSLEGRVVAADEHSCRLTADLHFREPTPPELPRLKGVLVVKNARGESYYQMDAASK
jgi:DsbC/DsbD-like thiol-disulfide interchange protein